MRVIVLALSLSALGAGAALAGPFDGTWSRDPARSHDIGDVITFAPAPGGMRYMSGPEDMVVRLDKEVPLPAKGYTSVWMKTDDGGLKNVVKFNGRVSTEVAYALAPDGKSFVQTVDDHPTEGKDVHLSYTYRRLSGAKGFMGRWRSVAGEVSPAEMTISTPAPGRQSLRFATSGTTYEGPVDGADTLSGPGIPPNATVMSKAVSPRVREIRTFLSGKPYSVARWTVSADGKTLTETQHFVRDPAAVATYVYVRKE